MNALTSEQIDSIFIRWYEGETTESLLKTLNINKQSSLSFAKHFPPIPCKLSCPYCSMEMHAFRSTSANYKKSQNLYDKLTAHCLDCGHDTKKATCKCEGCISKRHKESIIFQEKQAEKQRKRIIKLDRLYNNIAPIDFEQASLTELIYLYTLCHQSTCEDVTLISAPSTAESPLSPCDKWNNDIIQFLLNYIAPLSDDETLLQIDEDGNAKWHGQHVYYRIKIIDIDETDFLETLLIHIKKRINNLSLDEKFQLASLFEKLMITECINYLEYMRSDFGLPHAVGIQTTSLFKNLIQTWRIDQIYTIIWICCKDILAFQAQNKVSRQHASNLVIGKIRTYVDKAIQKNWEIKFYYRSSKNKKHKQSSISYVLFNKLLDLGGYGIEYNFQDVLTRLKSFEHSLSEDTLVSS